MSHCFGAMCETHKTVMVPDGCPEGCGSHGYTYVACGPRCPEYQDAVSGYQAAEPT